MVSKIAWDSYEVCLNTLIFQKYSDPLDEVFDRPNPLVNLDALDEVFDHLNPLVNSEPVW